MPSANALRIQIEHALENRFPAALTPVARTIREVAATGIASVDRLLDGGLPVGAISEITGPVSSGRTSLALAVLARHTRQDRVCAWIDADDAFDAESAAASGVDLKRLLWVRCLDSSASGRTGAGEGAPAAKSRPRARIWARLDQALRATDLVLQAGGFAAIALDLGSTDPEHGCRIPLATWFRFRQAADRTRCCLLVLGQAAFAQSSAAVQLECAPQQATGKSQTVLSGFSYEVRSGRQRFAPAGASQRKPPASSWSSTCAWEREAKGPQRQAVDAAENQGPQRLAVRDQRAWPAEVEKRA